jgi:hypothetical protein
VTDDPTRRRVHGVEAAGAGDLGSVQAGEVLGACPSCGAELRAGTTTNPASARVERGLLHPMPFCAYFGETEADEIEREVARRRRWS